MQIVEDRQFAESMIIKSVSPKHTSRQYLAAGMGQVVIYLGLWGFCGVGLLFNVVSGVVLDVECSVR